MKKYIMSVVKIEDELISDSQIYVDKIGGDPTHLPPEDIDVIGYFVMQIYNNERISGNKDVLCWQFYQDEFGGPMDVIDIPRDAKLNTSKQIKKRRWIDEYLIKYEEIEENIVNEKEEYISVIGGKPNEFIKEDCENENAQYVGIIYDDLCPYGDLGLGYDYMILAKDSEGSLVVI
ncbi:hypothetical protein [Clostridium aquiflavi]|uniref:DUF4241 domain-containing protein n=1 Tax=Clostridium aquiflavi TaxID=3073603 RepID=A0ABU1EKP0_9CLOT|nr:hypothetical protein [Clostridium sp. 5N-1]MDR5588960.1 hypothetical protein [Clostridium sp. 5N-1]